VQLTGDPPGDTEQVVAVGADRVRRALGGLQPVQEILDTDQQLACGCPCPKPYLFCCILVIMQETYGWRQGRKSSTPPMASFQPYVEYRAGEAG
jgi:hypothetical protein